MAGHDCVFCAIVAGQRPAEVVHRDAATVAFMDIQPATYGHLLVVPVACVPTLWELGAAPAGALMETARRMAHRVREALAPDGLNLFQANGAAAFQTVFHVHVHLVPRWQDDGLQLPWQPTPGDPERIRAAAAALRAV
jgi:histidine triad (HIT) family protein